MKIIYPRFCYLLLCMFLPFSSIAQNAFESELNSLLQTRFPANQPGAAVLVYEKGRMIYQNQSGVANTETKQPITVKTTFRMASVSKQFTAMGILILEKQKKLKLTDKLSRYFPDLKPELADKITLAHLLTHTSGIPDYENLMDSTWKRQILDEDIPALLQSQTNTYFEPGSRFKYSNTAFCLLAIIVQQVSGKPYASFMKENIFVQLGMKHTFVYEGDHLVETRGMGYTRNEANQTIIPSDQSLTSATKGDGCVYTSIEDYLKWYLALKDNRLVNLQVRLNEIGYLFPDKENEGYGLGWFFKRTDSLGKSELTHTGSTCGFSNVVIQVPEEDLLIVYFSNIAGNHEVFDEVQSVINRHVSYKWKVNWKAMHQLTD